METSTTIKKRLLVAMRDGYLTIDPAGINLIVQDLMRLPVAAKDRGTKATLIKELRSTEKRLDHLHQRSHEQCLKAADIVERLSLK